MKNLNIIFFQPGILILGFLLYGGSVKAQYQINGVSSQISCGCYELTPDQQFLGGSVWNVTQIDLTNPFDFTFDIFLGCANGQSGGDGIAFVLQPLNVNAGTTGGGLGYDGITPSLAIEYDTYYNSQYNDLGADHIAIQSNGVVDHTDPANTLGGPVQMSSTTDDVEDCGWHTTQIVWDPALQLFAVFFDGVFRLAYNGDIVNNIFGGNPNVYWGFTSSTGNRTNLQQFCISLQPEFTIASNSVCVDEVVTFNETSSASNVITAWDWDFGDGSTSSGASASHAFLAAGTFDVELTITSDGCTETFTEQITVQALPVVELGSDLLVCPGTSEQLNLPNSIGNGTYVWSPATDLDNGALASPTSTPTIDRTYTLTYTENGCSNIDDITLTVAPAAVADAGSDTDVCVNSTVQLNGAGGATYQWDNAATLDDATIGTPAAGPLVTTTYTVTVTDANGCVDTDDVLVTVNPLPIIDAGPDQTVCVGGFAQLNAVGTGAFLWNNDPSISAVNIADPVATPIVNTVYTVTLTDANNCQASDDVNVDAVVTLPVDAGADATICQGEQLQLQAIGAVNYTWSPAINLTSSLISDPIFNGLISETIFVLGEDLNGCSATDSIIITVLETPVAAFSISGGAEQCEGLPVIFDASASTGPITDYLFDMGDQPIPPNATSINSITQFTFPAANTYTVTLMVNVDICADTLAQTINVNPTPVADFTFVDPCQNAAFNVVDGSTISAGVITSYNWDFGDGSTFSGQSPSQVYALDGAFDVQLIVVSDLGCSDTIVQTTTVLVTPTIDFSGENVCLGDFLTFVNNSTASGTSVTWAWNVGDGTTYSVMNPTHLYQVAGTYGVSLSATTTEGCSASESISVSVDPVPELDFSTANPVGCEPMLVQFNNYSSISSGSISSFTWDVGSISGIDAVAPAVSYTTAGIYDVTLFAVSDQGCEATKTEAAMITVNETPEAAFDLLPGDQLTMLDPRINVNNNSVDAVSYLWTFGDGDGSSSNEPIHFYLEEGTYTVTLLAYNGGCTDAISHELTIDPETFIYVPSAFTPNSDGNNDVFYAEGTGIEDFQIFIHDRWGKEMFHSAEITVGWDGRIDGKIAPQGVYVYSIEILDALGDTRRVMGHVTIIR